MKTNAHEYIISGGQEGKSRLGILSAVLADHTGSLLAAQGLSVGQSFLDVGSGGGNVAMMAAKIVGDTGRVVAVDFDDTILSLSAQDAAAQDIRNISFQASSAYDIHYSNEFDVAYARFLLSHLQQPAHALQNMLTSVKSGGKVIVEDIQFSGHFCYQANPAFYRYLQYYIAAAAHNGQNAEIGPSLFSLFQQAGISDIGFDVIQPAHSAGSGKWMAYVTLDKIKKAVVEYGIASAAAVADTLAELKDFTEDEQTILSLPRIFRVWGTKA